MTLKTIATRRSWRIASLLLGMGLWLAAHQPASGQSLPLNIGLSPVTVTPLDWETSRGSFTLTNLAGLGQGVQVESVSLIIEFVGSSGASSTCKAATVFSNMPAGTTIAAGVPLTVNYSAVCTEGTPPLDMHEVHTIVGVKFAGSSKVFTTSGTSHL